MQKLTTGVATVMAIVGWGVHPALAQAELTRAEVYRVNNQVDISRQSQNTWTPASVGDALAPRDAVRTAAQSRAELLFNEGTLVRTGEGTVFRFPPGRRSFELVDGSALLMIRPGLGNSNITTPQANITARGTALIVQHDPNRNASLVGVLTDSAAGPVVVSDKTGEVTVELRAGQFVSVINGVVGLVEQFVLPMFYDSVDLAIGLGTGQEGYVAQQSPEVQTTLNAVQAEAIAPLANQIAWLDGLCSSTLGTVGSLQEALQESPLLRMLVPSTIPPEQITLQIPDSDVFLIPVRSLSGLTWLGNYCQTRR